MAKEKLCPLLDKECIRDGCKMWIKLTISGTDREGKKVTNTPPEQCAFVWSGIAALKAMQFPGPGRPVPAARSASGPPAPGQRS